MLLSKSAQNCLFLRLRSFTKTCIGALNIEVLSITEMAMYIIKQGRINSRDQQGNVWLP